MVKCKIRQKYDTNRKRFKKNREKSADGKRDRRMTKFRPWEQPLPRKGLQQLMLKEVASYRKKSDLIHQDLLLLSFSLMIKLNSLPVCPLTEVFS